VLAPEDEAQEPAQVPVQAPGLADEALEPAQVPVQAPGLADEALGPGPALGPVMVSGLAPVSASVPARVSVRIPSRATALESRPACRARLRELRRTPPAWSRTQTGQISGVSGGASTWHLFFCEAVKACVRSAFRSALSV
jgi:hypothetical protein